ncbi:DUF4381 domain-containing protein [Marinobacter sp.]|uniref:DUF4381 domain-containing protein n=1 Tax=Marinobacter sp. TaxID=50741 RepID=UPI002B49245F|nr:DUF4381 domain-containing protein [Marinobacter sp.]HKK55478.1 DUF4381 domain-containing protein [Marinobacter sp.]
MEQDPLSQLRDIHIPPPEGFWPPAPGWWFVLLLVIGLAIAITVWLRRRRQKNAWYRIARRRLDRLAEGAAGTSRWFNELNSLLKQSALARYPDRQPQSLSGSGWVDFLLETSPADPAASRPVVSAMVASCYQPSPTCPTDDAIRFARVWIGGQKC